MPGRAGRVIVLAAIGVLMLVLGSAEFRAVISPTPAGSVIDRDVAEPAAPAAAPASRVKLTSSKQSRHRFSPLPTGPATAASVVMFGAGAALRLALAARRRSFSTASSRPRGPPALVSL